jgi:hypothetical protein
MRAIEECKERRGEPVIVTVGVHDLPGTIEWGDDAHGYSVCTEPAGARYVVSKREIRPDPGGERPLWTRRHGDAATPR